MANRKNWILMGAGFITAVLLVAALQNLVPAVSGKPETPGAKEEPKSQAKWKASQKATLEALTQAMPQKPEAKVEAPCTNEFENLAYLAIEEIMNRIQNQEADISDSCMRAFETARTPLGNLIEDIRSTCKEDANETGCMTPLIDLKSRLIDAGTRGMDATTLPDNILLSKIFARHAYDEQTTEELSLTLALIHELESRNPELGFDNLKLYIMSDLAQKDQTHVSKFEEMIEKSKADNPEDALAYRFKYNFFNNDMEKTEALLKEHIQNHPKSAQAQYLMAVLEFRRGRADDALQYAQRAAEMDPSNLFIRDQTQKLQDNPKAWMASFMLPSITYNFGS